MFTSNYLCIQIDFVCGPYDDSWYLDGDDDNGDNNYYIMVTVTVIVDDDVIFTVSIVLD